jgi:hypothetical protein
MMSYEEHDERSHTMVVGKKAVSRVSNLHLRVLQERLGNGRSDQGNQKS